MPRQHGRTKTSMIRHVIGNYFARRVADAGFGLYAHTRSRRLDRVNVTDVQNETLSLLVRHAQNTQFGRDHHFRGIRSIADFQERVPLRDYDAFWKEYWQPAFPNLANATWPGPIPYLALSSGTTTGTT